MTAAGNELDASDSRHRHACDKVLLERFGGDVVSRKEGGEKSTRVKRAIAHQKGLRTKSWTAGSGQGGVGRINWTFF